MTILGKSKFLIEDEHTVSRNNLSSSCILVHPMFSAIFYQRETACGFLFVSLDGETFPKRKELVLRGATSFSKSCPLLRRAAKCESIHVATSMTER